MNWYTRCESRRFRILIIFFAVFVFFGLPTWTTVKLVDFFTSFEIKTVTETKSMTMMEYPKLTVCHAKYFHKDLMKSQNISDELANYMTMVLDPNVKDFLENIKITHPEYIQVLHQYKNDLDRILKQNQMSLLDLYHKIAVRCSDFVRFCEVHRRIYNGQNSSKSCCEEIFNQIPFFTTMGTCYSTNTTIWESYPFTFSNIKVWLDAKTKKTPVYQFAFRGSDAMDRGDIYYTISNQDHPASALMQSPNKVSRGASTLIGLTLKEVSRLHLDSIYFP